MAIFFVIVFFLLFILLLTDAESPEHFVIVGS